MRPLLATYWGAALGVVAIAIWATTFEPHGGPGLSWFLFPLARLGLEAALPHQSITPAVWFGSAWLQWVALGGAVDLFRMLRRRRAAAGGLEPKLHATPEQRVLRLLGHAVAGWNRARGDAEVRERAREWLLRHPSAMPSVDALWLDCLDGRGPLFDWLSTDPRPERWSSDLALHSVLAGHPFPDLPRWVNVDP